MSDVFGQMWEKKWSFFAIFFIVMAFTYIVLLALDFYPEPPTSSELEDETAVVTTEEITTVVSEPEMEVVETLPEPTVEYTETVAPASGAVLPVRISIESLGKTVTVLNPTSRAIADLDTALLSGVVRHPDSAALNQEGNVFILGHSSYLPNVFNKNFQALNGIQNLEWGDTITVYSETAAYEYRVERVYRARAQDVTVPIAGTGHKLTLATCNSFGTTDDRYIVEASLQKTRPLTP